MRRGGGLGAAGECGRGVLLGCQSHLEAGDGALGSVRASSSPAVVLSMCCCLVVAGSCSEQMAVGVLVCSLTG